MAIGADIAVEKAPRRSKERLRKCQRTARKQLRKWTHISCSVRSESAAEDLQLNIGVRINSTALQVEVPAPIGEISEYSQNSHHEMNCILTLAFQVRV